MDRKLLDRLVPLVYVALVVASALFFSKALAGIAIFGALALAAYYSAIRQRLFPRQQTDADEPTDGLGNRAE
jgi:hypothetical protein